MTLNITTWPDITPPESLPERHRFDPLPRPTHRDHNKNSHTPLPRRTYDHLLQAYAQEVLGEARLPQRSTRPSGDRSVDILTDENDAQSTSAASTSSDAAPRGPSRLRLIGWGALDGSPDSYCAMDKLQTVFYRSEMVGPGGERAVYAVPIQRNLSRYVEPRSDVLDLSRLWSPHRPTGVFDPILGDYEDD